MATMEVDHSLDDESRVGEVCAILSVGCALTTIVVTLRIYTRTRLLGFFGFDDAFMVAAQTLAIGAAIAIGLETKYGLGRHTWLQPKEYYIPYMKAFYTSIVVYNVAMCLVKISILLQFRRIFANTIMQRITAYGVAFFSAWAVTLSFLLTLICIPVAAFWDTSIQGTCLDNLTIWYIMASVNLVSDFALFIMPLPVISSLRLPRKQKYTLVVVFGLGLFTCIISVIRIRTLKEAAAATDPNWENVSAAYWSFLEVCTSILAASLPTLRPVLGRLMPGLFATRTQRSTGRTAYPTGSSATRGRNSVFRKSTMASKPESTTSLNHAEDVELDGCHGDTSNHRRYSVNVSAGRDVDTDAISMAAGIRRTTVVTQHLVAD